MNPLSRKFIADSVQKKASKPRQPAKLVQAQMVTAAGKVLADFLVEAEVAFLKEVEKGIKKIAGSHLQTKVQKSHWTAWIEGEGTTRSDLEFKFMLNLISKGTQHDWVINFDGQEVGRGKIEDQLAAKDGALSVDQAVGLFKRHFSPGE